MKNRKVKHFVSAVSMFHRPPVRRCHQNVCSSPVNHQQARLLGPGVIVNVLTAVKDKREEPRHTVTVVVTILRMIW